MKYFKYVLLIAVVVLVAVIAIKTPKKAAAPENNEIDLSPEVNAEQLCYIWNTEAGDKAMLSMDIREENVIGEFYWLPAEKDRKTGIFKGKVYSPSTIFPEYDQMFGVWEASGEGVTNKEQLSILFDENIAMPGFGEMKLENGVYVYGDDVSYGPNLQRTDCGDEAMD
jgi:hypothetical protein